MAIACKSNLLPRIAAATPARHRAGIGDFGHVLWGRDSAVAGTFETFKKWQAEHEACEVSSSSAAYAAQLLSLEDLWKTGAQDAWAMVFGYHSEMVIAACAWANRQ